MERQSRISQTLNPGYTLTTPQRKRGGRSEDQRTTYQDIIAMEPGKRGGRPCIRGMRITVGDVVGWLAAGMSHEQIIDEYPELTERDIRACLAYAADRERRLITFATQ